MFNANGNFDLLKSNYLFQTIGEKITAYQDANPDAAVIKLGIGDVTRPLVDAVQKALHNAVDDMSKAETFEGYPPNGGYAFLKEAIYDNDYKPLGIDLDLDEIFVSGGAKSDTANFTDLFGTGNIIALTDPVYPVYVDTNVMAGRSGVNNDGRYEGFVYLESTEENGFVPGPPSEKVDLIYLCFPNNPTGYMPTSAEGDALASALERQADRGTKLVVLCDDAYFGLFYHLGGESMTESLFGRLTGRHPNLLAVKLDGATKELFVWGLRCGFLTFGPGRPETAEVVCEVLDAKVRGAIRGSVSNVPQLSQTLVERALVSPSLAAEREAKCETLRVRAEQVFEVANRPRYAESWKVYPFNSGYFMLVQVNGVDAEKLRIHLLEEDGVGLIATSPTDIRVAFSCLEAADTEPLFEALHLAIQALR